MPTMSRDATTLTVAHETTCAGMTVDPSMSGVHHRAVEIIVATGAFHHGRAKCHAKKETVMVATTTVRAISTTIAAIEDRKSVSNEQRTTAIAVTSAKPHAIGRLRGASRLLGTA